MRLPAFVCGGEDAARTRQNQNYCRAVVRFFFLSGGGLLPINYLPFLTVLLEGAKSMPKKRQNLLTVNKKLSAQTRNQSFLDEKGPRSLTSFPVCRRTQWLAIGKEWLHHIVFTLR